MPKALVIVESPAKAKTLERFLGRGYEVTASMGHVRDLPRSQLGVAVEDGFTPKYITIRGKGQVVSGLRDRAKKAGRILLATDPDREGEAISWHLCSLLGLPEDAPVRIAFHEITQDAVRRALSQPRAIDRHLVDAQQARRVLDRLVGYRLSPLLWRKVRGGLSAGRVQSVAVRLIVDREREIQAFRPEEYWTLTAQVRKDGQTFAARYWGTDGERRHLKSEAETRDVLAGLAVSEGAADGPLQGAPIAARVPFTVQRVQKRERRRNPAAPFTTATLQQEAARKLGFTVRRTMRVAQELYEGLPLAGEHVGLITYMRTDSVRIAESAVDEARGYVVGRWGEPFSNPRQGSAAAGAQDAHEGIRPTSVQRTPESVAGHLGRDQLRLYRLIWERFVASQMSPAVLDTVTADLAAGRHTFRASGSTIKFKGFMVLYVEGRDEAEPRRADRDAEADEDAPESGLLPELRERESAIAERLDPVQHFTEPPPRYTEAMLVRVLEEKGIGRPSTYAAIIETIESRGYVRREQRRFFPTDLGNVVTDLLREHFPNIVDVAFTAGMERDLDAIETGKPWQGVLREFYDPFAEALEHAEANIGEVQLPEETTDEVCAECGRPMAVRRGRFGPFLACTGYPECKTTRPILERTGVGCPKCGQGQIVVRRSKRGRTFYGCDRYPECDFVLWERPVGLCPECGQPLVEKRSRQEGRMLRCSNAECGHRAPLGEGADAGDPAEDADDPRTDAGAVGDAAGAPAAAGASAPAGAAEVGAPEATTGRSARAAGSAPKTGAGRAKPKTKAKARTRTAAGRARAR